MYRFILIISTICYLVGTITYYAMTKDSIIFTALVSIGVPIFIASISLRFAYKALEQWRIDKTINMHYRFKEERKTLLEEIYKLDQTIQPDKDNIEILYLDLLNELELISLLYQDESLAQKNAKQMFNTWIKNIYENESIINIIGEAKKEDPTAYEHLEKTYKEWNRVKK